MIAFGPKLPTSLQYPSARYGALQIPSHRIAGDGLIRNRTLPPVVKQAGGIDFTISEAPDYPVGNRLGQGG